MTHPSVSPARPVQKAGGFDIRILWGALAATAVMLPVVLLLLLRDSPKVTAESPTPRPDLFTPKPTPDPIKPPDPHGGAAIQLTAQPDITEKLPDGSVVITTDPPTKVATGKTPASKRDPATKVDPPTKADPPAKVDPPTKADPPAASGSGRLLAIATGGSCAFSVDGASKGSGSSLSVSLPAGKHTVVCKPASGAAKSRGATIKPNETTMLTFKF